MGPGVTFAGIPAPGQAPAQAAASLQVEQAGGVPPPPAQNGWTPRAAGPLRPRPAPYPMASRLLAAGPGPACLKEPGCKFVGEQRTPGQMK